MIVVDASVLVEAVTEDPNALRARLSQEELHTSQHVGVEVASALRRLEAAGRVTEVRAAGAIAAVVQLEVREHPAAPLIDRIWQLRHNVTPYDATYVAIAEHLGCPLVTMDAKLATAPGIRCDIDLVKR